MKLRVGHWTRFLAKRLPSAFTLLSSVKLSMRF
jgi:hypothetical protein